MKSILVTFQELKNTPISDQGGFRVCSLPSVVNHKIGISEKDQPMFFIKCEEPEVRSLLNSNLELISIQYNCKCQLINKKRIKEDGIYTVLSLKTDSVDLQSYFLEVIYLMIKKLPPDPPVKELRKELDRLIELFSKFSKPAVKSIQGLWAELLVIEVSNNPDYLIRAWHNSPLDKFDFNDGKDKIEVKSTLKDKRIHAFSADQLNPNDKTNLIIASVLILESGIGENIFDILDSIKDKVIDQDLLMRVNEIIVKTLGNDLEKAFEKCFDYNYGVDSLKYYDGKNVPRIALTNIPIEISNVHFDCDLTNVNPIEEFERKSLLHKCLT
jgi:hypothetical protein